MRSFFRSLIFWLVGLTDSSTRYFVSLSHHLLARKFSQVDQESYIELLSILKPTSNFFPLKRFGCQGDGGYVLLDNIKPETVCFSLGIAQEISFDIDIARNVSHVYMFDYSIASPPVSVSNASFYPLKVVREIKDPQIEIDLNLMFERYSPHSPIILKVDIEGSEWDVFLDVSSRNIERCDQIIVEFHGIQILPLNSNFESYVFLLRRMLTSHTIVNTHINNWDGYEVINGIPVPNVLEVTFVKNSLLDRLNCNGLTLESLNFPNNPSKPEFLLYPFDRIIG